MQLTPRPGPMQRYWRACSSRSRPSWGLICQRLPNDPQGRSGIELVPGRPETVLFDDGTTNAGGLTRGTLLRQGYVRDVGSGDREADPGAEQGGRQGAAVCPEVEVDLGAAAG